MRDLSYSYDPIKKKIENGSDKDDAVNVDTMSDKNPISNSSHSGGSCDNGTRTASCDAVATFTNPANTATTTTITTTTTTTSPTTTTTSNGNNKSLNKSIQSRILVVEANHDLRNLFQTYLNLHGFQIKVVDSGAAALVILFDGVSTNYDVIIINTHLPDRSGLDIAREIHKKKRSQRIVITTTTPIEHFPLESLNSAGLSQTDVLTKPFRFSKLPSMLIPDNNLSIFSNMIN
ncbi:MAG: response regulator [Thermoproteota archaeon]|nr:response regulator [Thermoproteota archaeon]